MSRQLVLRIGVACAALVVGASASRAQQAFGTISGTVTDQQDAVVPGALVEVRNTGTNAVFRTNTNENGFYAAPGLPVGTYEVSCSIVCSE